MKHCKKCNATKPLDAFHRDRGSRDGRTSYCRLCQITKTRKYYADNREAICRKDREDRSPERSRREKAERLQRKYGLTIEQYEAMLVAQGNGCAICGGPEPIQDGRLMAVDHCHSTGRVRGVLCSSCNRALGLFKDDPERLQAAAEYVVARGRYSPDPLAIKGTL